MNKILSHIRLRVTTPIGVGGGFCLEALFAYRDVYGTVKDRLFVREKTLVKRPPLFIFCLSRL